MSALLDNLPPDWDFATLGEINTHKAPTLNPKNFPNETFEYYSIPDYQRDQRPSLRKGDEIESSKLLLEPKTVLFGKLNPRVEKVWRVDDQSENRKIGSTEWITVLPREDVDRDFLYFLEWSPHVMPIAKTLVSGSTPSRQRVDPKSFYRLRVPLPPLPEQKKIAHILSTVQRAIEAQERIIQTTTELKKALMHKLFTEGLRNEPQKQTEIGAVPESWEVVPLGKYARVLNGYAFKSGDYVPDGVRLIRISNVSIGYLINKDDKYLPTSYLQERSAYALKEGDLILSLTRPIIKEGMKYCFIEKQHLPALLNQRVGRFEITDKRLRKDFLFQIIFSPYFINPLKYMAEGSNQPNVSPTRLEAFQIPIPTDMEEQEEIAKLLTGLNRKMELAKQKGAQLQYLFRTLLHELMTAKTRVHDLDLPSEDRAA